MVHFATCHHMYNIYPLYIHALSKKLLSIWQKQSYIKEHSITRYLHFLCVVQSDVRRSQFCEIKKP